MSNIEQSIATEQKCLKFIQVKNHPLNDALYSGGLCDGIPLGHGKLNFSDKVIKEGVFIEGGLVGRVVSRYSEGFTLIGEFRGGKEHGRSTLITKEGEVKEVFLRHGKVVENVASTEKYSQYIGETNDIGQKSGIGKGVYAWNGDSFYGRWESGSPNGFGIYRWGKKDVSSFAMGNYDNGRMSSGSAVIFLKDNFKYIGQIEKGEEHGKGIKYYIGGELPKELHKCVFEGSFFRGLPTDDLDCSKRDDNGFWDEINNTQPDLMLLNNELFGQ